MVPVTGSEAERELVTPGAHVDDATRAGPQVEEGDVPDRVLLAWGERILERAVRYTRAEDSGKRVGDARFFVGKWAGKPVGLLAPGPGAPATAFAVEALGAVGARVLLGVGYACSMDPLLASGTLLAVKDALAGDGVSARYGADDEIAGFANVTDALEGASGQEPFPMRCGRAWTTDARHRVTAGDVKAKRAAGALAVDGESAALLAVARHRGYRAGALLVVADELVRFKPLDEPVGEDGDTLAYAWTPAPTGSLDRVTGGAVRVAFAALLGDLVAMDEAPATE